MFARQITSLTLQCQVYILRPVGSRRAFIFQLIRFHPCRGYNGKQVHTITPNIMLVKWEHTVSLLLESGHQFEGAVSDVPCLS